MPLPMAPPISGSLPTPKMMITITRISSSSCHPRDGIEGSSSSPERVHRVRGCVREYTPACYTSTTYDSVLSRLLDDRRNDRQDQEYDSKHDRELEERLLNSASGAV